VTESLLLCLQTQLGAAPVTALGVPLDGVISTEADPMRQRAVLPLLLGQCPLGSECLLGWL